MAGRCEQSQSDDDDGHAKGADEQGPANEARGQTWVAHIMLEPSICDHEKREGAPVHVEPGGGLGTGAEQPCR